jgi:threonine dehydrogenase-like Zn-dependent dehydrogenase
MNLPGSMLAAIKSGPGKATIVEVGLPELQTGQALVRVRACAICASDLPGWNAPRVAPDNPGQCDPDNVGLTGHEIAGEIVGVGPGVGTSRTGEAVWIDPIAGCGLCEECRDGRQTLCEKVSIVCGGYAEFVVAPAHQCRPIPVGLDYATASLICDMVGTPVGASKRAGIKPGESVAVWGLGPVGLGLVQVSLIAGASPVIGVDPVGARRARAETFGALTLDPSRPDYLSRLRELTRGKGPDVVLSSVGSDRASREAFEALRLDGRMVVVAGHPPAGGEVRKWVTGTWGCNERDWPEVLELVRSGSFALDRYITHRFPLRQIEEAFSIRGEDLEGSFKVLITNE